MRSTVWLEFWHLLLFGAVWLQGALFACNPVLFVTFACNSCCAHVAFVSTIAYSAPNADSQAVSAGIPAGAERVCVCQGGPSQEGRF